LAPHGSRTQLGRHRDDPGKLLEGPVTVDEVDMLGRVTDVARDYLTSV